MRMRNRLLFMVISTIVMAIGEGISAPPARALIATLTFLGPPSAYAASWGEVQAQRFVKVSSPSDSSKSLNPKANSNQRKFPLQISFPQILGIQTHNTFFA